MGLFDIFGSADAAQDAANKNNALFQQYGNQANNIYGTYGTQAGGALSGALDQSVGALGSGFTNQIGALQTGTTGAVNAGNAGVAAYAPLSALGDKYGGAVNSYLDALGVNGSAGQARAVSQFQTDPGFQFSVDKANAATINNASKLGIAGSGNTLDALGKNNVGYANQAYQQYLSNLAGFVNPELQATQGAASGIAGANKSLADIYNTNYTGLGSAYGANAGALAGLYTNYGQNQSNVFGNVAQGQAGALKDVTSGQAQGNTNVANADAQATSNFWNFLGNLGGAAAKAYSGGAGGAGASK